MCLCYSSTAMRAAIRALYCYATMKCHFIPTQSMQPVQIMHEHMMQIGHFHWLHSWTHLIMNNIQSNILANLELNWSNFYAYLQSQEIDPTVEHQHGSIAAYIPLKIKPQNLWWLTCPGHHCKQLTIELHNHALLCQQMKLFWLIKKKWCRIIRSIHVIWWNCYCEIPRNVYNNTIMVNIFTINLIKRTPTKEKIFVLLCHTSFNFSWGITRSPLHTMNNCTMQITLF